MVGWFFQSLSKLYMKTLYSAPCKMVDDLSIVAAYNGLKNKKECTDKYDCILSKFGYWLVSTACEKTVSTKVQYFLVKPST